MDMSWEHTGPAVTFPVATQVHIQTSTRTSSPVSFPLLPTPKRTFSEIINDAVVNIGKRSVQLLAVATVQIAKTAKRRLISRNDSTHAPGSSPRRSSPRRFSPHFRSIPSRSSPIFRQDLSTTPGRRPTAPVTPPRFLNKTRPYLMPGTYPITLLILHSRVSLRWQMARSHPNMRQVSWSQTRPKLQKPRLHPNLRQRTLRLPIHLTQ